MKISLVKIGDLKKSIIPIGVIIVLTGCIVLVGWQVNISWLKSVIPEAVSMKVNTAICFVLSGIATVLLAYTPLTPIRKIMVRFFGIIITIIGALTFIEIISEINFGIDQIFFQDLAPNSTSAPGRMTLMTSLCFMAIGLSFILSTVAVTASKEIRIWLSTVIAIPSVVTFLGYVLGIQSMYKLQYATAMPILNSILFLLQSFCLYFLEQASSQIVKTVKSASTQVFPRTSVIIIVLSIYLFEFYIMFLLRGFQLSEVNQQWIDSTLLVALLLPIIFVYILHPLLSREQELKELEHIQIAKQNLIDLQEMILSTIPFPMDIVDEKGKILFASTKMQEVLKKNPVGEACWVNYRDDHQQCKECPLHRTILFGETRNIEVSHVMGNRIFEIHHTGIIFEGKPALLEVFQDITNRKLLQGQIVQSDRMATMGMLAAGVAHEINNPLAFTQLNLENVGNILSKVDASPQIKDISRYVGDALSGIERISKIVKSLSVLSRKKNTENSTVDINRCLDAALAMAMNELKYKAQVIKEYAQAPMVKANEGELSQVFLNLIINASHSIKEGDLERNTLTLKTYQNANEVFVSIGDTGSGISEEDMTKLFIPFFTTKSSGVGTGLGLSISQGIIHSFGGKIEVQSKLGKGTTMTIKIPAAKMEKKASSEVVVEEKKLPELSGRFLVIDDEEMIREAISFALEDCTIVEADSGEAGRKILQTDRAFDFIICDMMMPKVSGKDLYQWLQAEYPVLAKRFIFITGGATTVETQKFFDTVSERILEKPFTKERLKKLVSSLKENKNSEEK